MKKPGLPALMPRGPGHQFVLYGDSCSGVKGGLHEQTFASINTIIKRLEPQPDFIVFPGDEIIGLVADEHELRAQWKYWFETEMAWLDRQQIPLWHTTGNHTTYNVMSEDVFRDVLHLPDNGPPGQKGLSYWVRRDDLLLVFVHTLWTGLGGEGHVEVQWLESVLKQHSGASYKIVVGHHPVFPVNGFSGTYQREIGHEYTQQFWDILVAENVLAYVCSHILAFDVQANRGVLQICTAGAGTAHRMPEGVEYLHCIQAALDAEGLRYQVFDSDGQARESLNWPLISARDPEWQVFVSDIAVTPFSGKIASGTVFELRFKAVTAPQAWAPAQTLFSAFLPGEIAPIWLGLRGPKQTLTLIVGKKAGRSPGYWFGPNFPPDQPFDIHLAFCPDMGPGGILYRNGDETAWTSMRSATSNGIEDMLWPPHYSIGHGQDGEKDRPFKGDDLTVTYALSCR
ncbi:metallophosphoesterase family protein [Agrobacterium vitis]|uniref:metallophosphoesterase family protein n=1 Tax=Agrobacterium vitis TaxID=373 RepID=UPI003D28A52C